MNERDIFLAVLDIPEGERSAYLEQACAGDVELHGRVESLLHSHEAAGSFLNLPSADDRTQSYSKEQDEEGEEALTFLAPSDRPQSLGRIGQYEVLEVLGRGAFGVVFRAFDDVLQRVVAVKVLAPSLAVTSPARKRFLREAQSAAAVRHENVVQIHAVGDQPLPHLVMEFVPGETLQDRLNRTGPLEVTEVLRTGRQVAEGLAAAHEQGLIHRDVKPSNILIDQAQERAKISDFGLARAADDASLTRSGVVAGTPLYMAPEQARGETLDHRADLFSLGSVLYVMLTGRPPFRATGTMAVLKRVCDDTPRPIREVISEVPEWLCRIVEKLHAKTPAERYQSAREVADVLTDCEAQLKTHGDLRDHARIPGATPRSARRWPWQWALVAPILVLLTLVLSWAFPTLALYSRGHAEIAFSGHTDIDVERMLIRRDGKVVEIDRVQSRAVLTPGDYEVEAQCVVGYEATKFQVDTSGLLSWAGSFTRVEDRPVILITLRRGEVAVVGATAEKQRVNVTPFVLLGKDERRFATLADAVKDAPAGAVVEIRGNGPFVMNGLTIERPLTIRTSEGFAPVLEYDLRDGLTFAFLNASAAIRLEGLTLRNSHGQRNRPLVNVAGHPLAVANCRFVSAWGLCRAAESPAIDFRNCEFYSTWPKAAAIDWSDSPSKGSLRMTNCVTPNWALFLFPGEKAIEAIEIEFADNSFVNEYLLSCWSGGELLGDGKRPKPFRLTATNNLLFCRSLFRVEINAKRTNVADWPRERVKVLAEALFDWKGQGNVYLAASGYELYHSNKTGQLTRTIQDRDEWKKLWGKGDVGELSAGLILFGALRQKVASSLDQLAPADFRLTDDSPAKGKGKDGKDPGANADLVGPGSAYEQWKKSQGYQDWSKRIDALMQSK